MGLIWNADNMCFTCIYYVIFSFRNWETHTHWNGLTAEGAERCVENKLKYQMELSWIYVKTILRMLTEISNLWKWNNAIALHFENSIYYSFLENGNLFSNWISLLSYWNLYMRLFMLSLFQSIIYFRIFRWTLIISWNH